jgi:hypothetical protein
LTFHPGSRPIDCVYCALKVITYGGSDKKNNNNRAKTTEFFGCVDLSYLGLYYGYIIEYNSEAPG